MDKGECEMTRQMSAFEIRQMTAEERKELLQQLKTDRMIARSMNSQGMPPTTMRKIRGTYRRLITIMKQNGEIKNG